MRTLIAIAALAAVAFAPMTLITPASAAAPAPVVYGDNGSVAWHDPDIRPHGFILGQMFITRLRWSHWGALNARGASISHLFSSSQACTRHIETMYLHQVPTHRAHRFCRVITLRCRDQTQPLPHRPS